MLRSNWLRPRHPYTIDRRPRRACRFIRPQLELLEDRLAPASFSAGNTAELASDITAAHNTLTAVHSPINDGTNHILSPIAGTKGVPVAEAADQIGNPRVGFALQFPEPTTVSVSPVNTTFSPMAQLVSLTAKVTDGSLTVNEGTVTFTVMSTSGKVIGTVANVAVVNDVATTPFTIPANTHAGSYQIVANYSDPYNIQKGMGGSFASSTGHGTLTIAPAGPIVVSLPNFKVNFPNTDPMVPLDDAITFKGIPVTEGQVQFTIVGLASPPVTAQVVNGQASVAFALPANTPVGTYTVLASYSDSAGNYLSGTGTSTLTVVPSRSIVTINNVSIFYGLFNEQETLSAVARDPNGVVINEGFVTFTDGGQTATAPIVNGLATVTLTIPLMDENPFAHSISLAFGDARGNLLPSTSLFQLEQTLLYYMLQMLAIESMMQMMAGNT